MLCTNISPKSVSPGSRCPARRQQQQRCKGWGRALGVPASELPASAPGCSSLPRSRTVSVWMEPTKVSESPQCEARHLPSRRGPDNEVLSAQHPCGGLGSALHTAPQRAAAWLERADPQSHMQAASLTLAGRSCSRQNVNPGSPEAAGGAVAVSR